ncbi:helix-turn-helix domain-containing protein [Mycobacterium sp. AT1]|uniref:helix-turn-helix domain-containing protein n=1 Tax=Mycobacterium sp. AT1 TaxID=1961706 RepID=UPI0009ADF22E|nr:helix-turn-helix domain-containing protein [Mycobacterium sp. AT1]OPX05956.1 hypothetical protein B1790_29650 [Mycobacterium sp. AT1]
MTAAESGLMQGVGFVVLSGPALRAARDSALIAVKHRKMSGVPYQTYEALACKLHEVMSYGGPSDTRSPAISKAADVDRPNVTIAEVAVRLGISERHARRLAPKLGGQKIAGSWFVDELAIRQHLEGKK